MKRLLLTLALVLVPLAASAAEMDADTLAKRVGQVFAGYDDFWVWINQRFKEAGQDEVTYRGRAYFKREKMFRLNFGQPPFLIEGTDGVEYWKYNKDQNLIQFCPLNEKAPVHVLFGVFAAGEQMVKALDRYFDVDIYDPNAVYGPDKIPAYKLVLTLKPERLKELYEQAGNKLIDPNAKQTWTFWVDKETFLPRQIQVDWENKDVYIFELEDFHANAGLREGLFRRPNPPGVKVEPMKEAP